MAREKLYCPELFTQVLVPFGIRLCQGGFYPQYGLGEVLLCALLLREDVFGRYQLVADARTMTSLGHLYYEVVCVLPSGLTAIGLCPECDPGSATVRPSRRWN